MRRSVVLFVVLLSAISVHGREWTDTTGEFRVTAELVVVRNGMVVLEKTDGSIISVPLERLAVSDQQYLRDLPTHQNPFVTTATGQSATMPDGLPEAETSEETVLGTKEVSVAADANLPQKVHEILKVNCHRCHGEDGTSEGGFNFVLNLEKLALSMIDGRQAEQSLLYERMIDTDSSAMPPEGEEPRPSAADIALIKTWIQAGAPAVPQRRRPFISNDQMVQAIVRDQKNVTDRSQKFLRYFTLTHAFNAGATDDELQTYRNAFAKLVNSLSWNKDVVLPTAIDPERTIFRIDIRELNWTRDLWQEIERSNPYFLASDTPEALECYDMSETRMPHVRIDWFVNAASKPPLYHAILEIPDSVDLLEQNLHVNAQANIAQEKVMRAGFNRSGVSQNNRLIEWHRSAYGSYWKSYDFSGNTGSQNLFERPLGPSGVQRPFRHDGGELIFTLPNGFQGYMLVDAGGARIDKGPTEIVSDPKQADKTVTNGVSCMSCHYTGIIPKADEIHEFVKLNQHAFENADDVLAIYPGTAALNQIYESDARRFAEALNKIGIKSLSRGGEPISAMALKFQEELDLSRTAFEFGLQPADFEQRLKESIIMARSFGALRTKGGTIKRDVFATLFGRAAAEFRLTPEGRFHFAGPASGIVKLTSDGDVKVGSIRAFPDLGWGVESLAFSPNGGLLAAGKPDRAVLMFDIQKSKTLNSKQDLRNLDKVSSCAFTPDGTKLLTAGDEIMIWDVDATGIQTQRGQFAGHARDILCMSISRDGQFVLSGDAEKKVRYWRLEDSRELAAFDSFTGAVKACCILPSGNEALATDGSLLLHIDLRSLKVTKTSTLTRSSSAGQAAAFSWDGRLVAAGDSYDIRIWDVASGIEQTKLDGSREIQWGMTFTPDGTRLLSGGHSKLNVWEIKTSRRLSALSLKSSGYVKAVAASPDNLHAAAISTNAGATLEVFRIPESEE